MYHLLPTIYPRSQEMHTMPSPPATSSPTISKGTEILCFASIIPALAFIFYISSRIMRSGAKVKKFPETEFPILAEEVMLEENSSGRVVFNLHQLPCSSSPT